MKIYEKIETVVKKKNSLVCVGLDSARNKLPEHIKKEPNSLFVFNKAIIDATHDIVCAYKINSAFYESIGASGITQLKMTFDYINSHYFDTVITILDAKRADIGNTNNEYADFAFDYLRADCITLHPYLGQESLEPFLSRGDKGSIILCRTSNFGAGEFQDILSEGIPLYQRIAQHVAERWNKNKNCMLVVGATYPQEIESIRSIVDDMPLLIPGIGTQGGDVKKTVVAGLDSKGRGILINSSRAIIFASREENFSQIARKKAGALRDEINCFRTY